MENKINVQLIINEISGLRNEYTKAIELINANKISIDSQNVRISNLENRNNRLSEELEGVKKGNIQIKLYVFYSMFISNLGYAPLKTKTLK